jgi:hypothetical protein
LNDTILRNKYISQEIKSRIYSYKAVVRPFMTYTAERRLDTARTQGLLETTEIKVVRKTAGRTLLDIVRSEDMRRHVK